MTSETWFLFAAACGHLTLGVVAVLRGGKSTVSIPLGLLCIDLFAISLATLGGRLDSRLAWNALDSVFTSLAPAIALHFVLAFTGKLRSLRALAITGYVAAALLASVGLGVELGIGKLRASTWPTAFLGLWIPVFIGVLWLLASHLVRASDATERARGALVLLALLLGGSSAATDVWNDLDSSIPSLGPLGMLVGTALVAVAVLRFELFEQAPRRWHVTAATGIALAAVIAQVGMFKRFGGDAGLLLFGTALIALLSALGVREVTRSRAEERMRLERHALLGRFAAQMAHDLKNPLAALIGAAQFLELRTAERDAEEHRISKLLLDQARRMRGVVDSYERLARVEPIPSLVDLNALVREVTALQSFAKASAIELELDADLPRIDADPDLLRTSLENLLANALEALEGNGRIAIETCSSICHGHPGVLLRLHDTGRGMSARDAERAFDDFFTTKATGSGLGLGFVRRVVLAHRGTITLDTKLGRGTTIEIGFVAHAPSGD